MFQRFEWCPSVELLHVAKLQGRRLQNDRKATPKAAKRMFLSRVSEAPLGSFSGHFWEVLGAKLMVFQRVEWCPSVELLHVAKLQGWRHQSDRKATPKAAQNMFFSRVSEATLGSFSGQFREVLDTKVSGFFYRFEWCPSVELLHVAMLQGWRLQSDRKATPKAAKKMFFLGFQEQCQGLVLVTIGMFWAGN